MNTEAVKQEIANVIEETRSRIRHMRQHAPSKKYLAQLEELGLTELMPANFGNTDAQAVIAAATDAGGKGNVGWSDYGDASVSYSDASKLYQLLNEKEEIAVEVEAVEETETKTFVAMTSIGVGTGLIFLAEGSTEQEAFNNGVANILPLDKWQHASIYDVTKRKNIQVVTKARACQLGYRGKGKPEPDWVESEDFGAY
jgi:hypothetical protein